jgi:hypothetical protein
MAGSIRQQLEELERTGRVTARGRRPVHAEFGFATIEPDETASTPARSDHRPTAPTEPDARRSELASSLDDAWSRLKRTATAERH